MAGRILKKRIRAFKRQRVPAILVFFLLIAGGLFAYAGFMTKDRVAVDPKAFQPLLQLIAEAESDGNYNAYFSNAGNTSIDFTKMTIAEVMAWQKEFIKQGQPSDAVGRYQIISPTLKSLVEEMSLNPNQKFDQAMQDRMALTLMLRRGAADFVNDKLSREEFAAQLAKEWAALPKVLGDNPQDSYYAGDGLNRSLVTVAEILAVIDKTSPPKVAT